MKFAARFLVPLSALLLLCGAAKKPDITVRFHVEANQHDGEAFATPVQLKYPPRPAYIEKVPSLSERNIKAIYPFPAADGSWGCAFKLDDSGRLHLEVLSTERKGSALIAFISTKVNTHQAAELMIDQRVTDGVISIPSGLTELETDALRKQFPVWGAPTKKK